MPDPSSESPSPSSTATASPEPGQRDHLTSLWLRTASVVARHLFVLLAAVCLYMLLARWLGPEGVGRYQIAVLLPLTLATLLDLGLSQGNAIFVSRRMVEPAVAARASSLLILITLLAALPIVLAIVDQFSHIIFPGVPRDVMLLALVMAPFMLTRMAGSGILHGRNRYTAANLGTMIVPVTVLAGAVILVGSLDQRAAGAVLAASIGEAVGAAVILGAILRPQPSTPRTPASGSHHPQSADHMPAAPSARDVRTYLRAVLPVSLPLHTANLVQWLNFRADLFLINLLLGPAATGLYATAVLVGERLGTASQAAATVLLPQLSELAHDEQARRRLTPAAVRWITWLAVIGAIVIGLISTPLLSLLFGNDFADAAAALRWLLPGLIALTAAHILAADLAARGKVWTIVIAEATGLAPNIALNLLLVPLLGIVGAAVASSIAYCITASIIIISYLRITRLPLRAILAPPGLSRRPAAP